MSASADTEKRYDIIYTDPPWPQKKSGPRRGKPNQYKPFDYPTMSVEDCFKTHDPFFSQAAEKHNVFMWTIDKFLIETEKRMADRGYKVHARFIWDKERGISPAFTVRFSHEYLIWFYKPGKMLMPRKECQGKYPTVMREMRTVHSRKPQCAYEMIEDMFPDAKKIELFARNTRDGWDCFGNEIEQGGITP